MALCPSTETELAGIVREATCPFRIEGGGTRSIGHSGAAEILRTTGLAGVTLYEPGALTLVAQAGTPLAKIETLLASEGQRLPFEMPDMCGLLGRQGISTIGGVVAANASGPRRIQVGACRDSLIGVRFVDGTGAVIKNGGRVMKNVTGYDLVKLMAGSHGTLGVLTEVSFKVLPVPEAAVTLTLNGLSPRDAVAAMSTALGSPYEISGAASGFDPALGESQTSLRIEGFTASVTYRSAQIRSLLSKFGEWSVVTDLSAVAVHWQKIRDVAAFHAGTDDVWRISVKPTDAPMIIGRLPENARTMMDWGGGLVWVAVHEGTDLRAHLGPFSGHATRVRGGTGDGIRAFPPEPVPLAALAKGLRDKFDPRGVLNPGLM